MSTISDKLERKFTDIIEIPEGWEINTDTGFQPVSRIMQTVEYRRYHLVLENELELDAADDHIVMTPEGEKFLKDLKKNDLIFTKYGLSKVIECYDTGIDEQMYDIEVNSEDHTFYSNDILSHNTTAAAAYLLWFAMFNEDKTVLIVANKLQQAMEILDRIKFAYKEVPDYIRGSVTEFNKTTINFNNGSKIVARATSKDSGRGLSISCVSLDTFVNIKDKGEIRINELLDDEDLGLHDNFGNEVLTQDGYKNFEGFLVNEKLTFEVKIGNNKLRCTSDHKLNTRNGYIELQYLNIGDEVYTESGYKKIQSIKENKIEKVVDLVEVEDVHSYYTNDILSHNCLYVDELSFVEPYLQSEFWSAIQPVLSTGGKSIITSTPNNDEDKFAELWRGANDNIGPDGEEMDVGKNGYKPIKVTWHRHPDRDEKWAASQRAQLGEEMFLREMECEFISFDTTLINPLKLARLQKKEPIFRLGKVRWFEKPKKGSSYFVALDPSLGTSNDPSAIQVFEMPSMKQVAEWVDNKSIPKQQVNVLMDILYYLEEELTIGEDYLEDSIFWTFENNTLGESILQIIEDTGLEQFPGQIISEKKVKGTTKRFRMGLNTTNRNKLNACSKLKTWMDTDKMIVSSAGLIHQMKNFVSSGASYKGKSGIEDDLIMATVLCVRMIEIVSKWDIFDEDTLSNSLDFEEDDGIYDGVPFVAV